MAAAFLFVVVFFVAFFLAGFLFSAGFRLAAFGSASSCAAGPFYSSRATVRHHLIMKAKAGKTSDSHMYDLESRLRKAIEYFGTGRDPRTITADEVRAWGDELDRAELASLSQW